MKYRRLGATGLQVSEIGFGAWGLGSNVKGARGYGPVDAQESKLALRRAFEHGITFYDTSDVYGYGNSESLIGEALHDVRDRVVIATKVGMLDSDDHQDFSTAHIRKAVEDSLIRLQTDYIDLYQLHSPPVELLVQDDRVVSLLQSLQREGKIRAFGVSLKSPEDGLALINNIGFSCVQANFNMTDQRVTDCGLLDLCLEREVGFIGRTPLSFGFLTGRYSATDTFHAQDHRSLWKPEQLERWAGAYQLFADALVRDREQTQAQVALRYCLSYQGVSTVIPGMLNRQHVEENALASNLGPLEAEEKRGFEEVYRSNTFFGQD